MFALAITPASILLPIIGILLVTSEWSQRTALITFTLVPKRMRVMSAKIAAGVVLGADRARRSRSSSPSIAILRRRRRVDDGRRRSSGRSCLLRLISMISGIAFGRGVPELRAGDRPLLRAADRLGALGSIPALNDAAQWLDTARTTEPLTERTASAKEWAQFGPRCVWLPAAGVGLPLAVGLIRIERAARSAPLTSRE